MDKLINPDLLYATEVRKLAQDRSRILDFGAGRGVHGIDLRPFCDSIDGCDVDVAVSTNPYLHRGVVVAPGAALPYANGTFDLVMSRDVLEHVDTAEFVASEIRRVLAPGGAFIAITPNKYGYVALAAALVPNSLHTAVLKLVQPEKEAEDTFPTRYKMNTRRELERLFGPLPYFVRASGPSSYNFGSEAVAKVFTLLHSVLPEALQTAIVFRYDAPTRNADGAALGRVAE